MDFNSIMTVIIAGFALSLSPGPSMFYIMSRTGSLGRKAGLISALGLASGGACHVMLAALGISTLIVKNYYAFQFLKIIGAIYLFYLGFSAILGLFKKNNICTKTFINELKFSYIKIYSQAFFVELSNPKTILFFLAFIPQFINKNSDSYVMQSIILGLIVPLTALPSDLLIAFGGSIILLRLSKNKISNIIITLLSSLVLIYLGIRILL